MSKTKAKKKTKITKCPPAPQTVFFQQVQFENDDYEGVDREGSLGGGTDPSAYEKGRLPSYSSKLAKPSGYGTQAKSRWIRKATKTLEGHENKEEILRILRSGLHDE